MLDKGDELLEAADSKVEVDIAKARIAYRMWLAEKLIPKTYGAQPNTNINVQIDLKAILAEAQGRIQIPSQVQSGTTTVSTQKSPLLLEETEPEDVPPQPLTEDDLL